MMRPLGNGFRVHNNAGMKRDGGSWECHCYSYPPFTSNFLNQDWLVSEYPFSVGIGSVYIYILHVPAPVLLFSSSCGSDCPRWVHSGTCTDTCRYTAVDCSWYWTVLCSCQQLQPSKKTVLYDDHFLAYRFYILRWIVLVHKLHC